MSKKGLVGITGGVCIVLVAGATILNQSKGNDLVPVSERSPKVSDVVEIHSSNGQALTVYEMSNKEYENTDFRVPTEVIDDGTAKENYKQTGAVADIANNLSCISVEVLDEIFIDYIAETNDIGMVLVAKNYLSQEAIDKIAKEYVESTEDFGILESLKECVSEEVMKEMRAES